MEPMKKSDAIAYFGNQQKLAEAVNRSQGTVAEWPDTVPLEHAFVLERITRKRLRVDFALYPNIPASLRGGAAA